MKVLVAMSGGVDSSVAAALLVEQGHEVSGVTMKLWGGETDTGCCSVSDVDDARRVAQQLDIPFHVFNFGDDFNERVVAPYISAHAEGRTPNPCIECNRHLKFDRLIRRAVALGAGAVATGHHARIVGSAGNLRVARGADPDKDQSYVLYMLDQHALAHTLLPIGGMTKAEVRAHAARLGLRTAAKPDSQDVCFITSDGGRAGFLGSRIPLTPGRMIDSAGNDVGPVDAVELVTVGQRRGLGLEGGAEPRFAVAVDVSNATVTVGSAADLMDGSVELHSMVWAGDPIEGEVLVQCAAHGDPEPGIVEPAGSAGSTGSVGTGTRTGTRTGTGAVRVRWHRPHRRVAPGQSVVLYDLATGVTVLGGGLAT